jgi:chaperone modulatory protein CbpM
MERTLSLQAVCRMVPGVTEADLRAWLDQDWVRPPSHGGPPVFDAMDVARVRLIVELRSDLAVDDSTLPVILSLLDQLYATRNQLRRLIAAADEPMRARLAELLTDPAAPV